MNLPPNYEYNIVDDHTVRTILSNKEEIEVSTFYNSLIPN